MALSGDALAVLIRDALLSLSVGAGKTIGDIVNEEQKAVMLTSWKLICGEMVEYIQENAVVTVNMVNHTHTGVTTGGGTSGPPVTSTETGTVS